MRSAVLGQSLQTGVEPKASPDRVHERVGCAAVERDIRVAVLPQINLEAQHRGRAAGLSGLGHVCCCRIKLLRPDEDQRAAHQVSSEQTKSVRWMVDIGVAMTTTRGAIITWVTLPGSGTDNVRRTTLLEPVRALGRRTCCG